MIKTKKKLPYKAALILLGLIVAIVAVLEITNKIQLFDTSNRGDSVSTAPSAEENAAAAAEDANEKKALIEKGTKGDGAAVPAPSTPAVSQSVELSARQETNQTATIFTKIYGLGDGTCTLTILNGSKQVTQTAPIGYQPEYSSCAGFSVPISSLGNGLWKIDISVNSNGRLVTKSIEFLVE